MHFSLKLQSIWMYCHKHFFGSVVFRNEHAFVVLKVDGIVPLGTILRGKREKKT